MVKVNAPALSLDASGKLGGALVFSKWKGRNYVRQLVTPANPQSGGQVGVRSMFRFLTQNWAGLTAGNQATWEDRADNMIVSPFNAYLSYNQFRWRNFDGITKEDPALDAGTIGTLLNQAATAGVRSITIDIDVTVLNDNWGIAIFRGLAPGFSTAWDNCVQVILAASVASFDWVDSPLDPDTYYYNFRALTDEGVMGAEHGEVNATVT
jgi:hypothetical protein